MKNSISHVLTFILMIIFSVIIFFVAGEKELRSSVIVNRLEKENYYYKIYGTILSKVDDYVANEEVMQLYKDYLSIDLVKNDVNKIIRNIYANKSLNVSRYDDFYHIINEYSKDSTISKKYAEGINQIYMNNLFPTREMTLIHELYVPTTDVIFILIVALFLCLFISLLLFVLNKNSKFHIIAMLSSSIIFILPNIFIKFFGIFDNFVYTNEYFTDVLISIINNTVSNVCLFGLVIVILLFAYKFIKENYKLSK